ncbi:MAG: type I methionyl aminopeptidase [Candidatus Colwellbacteria bacterium]
MNFVKTAAEIKRIRQSSRILANTLRRLESMAHPGVDLRDLEAFARAAIKEHGGKPAFLGYRPTGAGSPFPFALCTSLNEVIVHGVPRPYKLKEGDILKLDLGVNWKEGISDSALTVPVGKISKEDAHLIELTREALAKGIAQARPGKMTGDIGHAIESTVTKGGGYIVDGLSGHGVGNALHEEPSIFNYGTPGEGVPLVPGIIIAIEPMISLTTSKVDQLDDDSYVTADGSNSAHFEHTVLITEKGNEVLTKRSSSERSRGE